METKFNKAAVLEEPAQPKGTFPTWSVSRAESSGGKNAHDHFISSLTHVTMRKKLALPDVMEQTHHRPGA